MTKRTYVTLEQDEMDDMLVGTLLAQERDHYLHSINIERYQTLLTAELANTYLPFYQRIEQLLADSKTELAHVEAILEALEPQLPSSERIQAALVRLSEKQAT